MGVRPLSSIEAANIKGLATPSPKPKADSIRTPIDGFDAFIGETIEAPHYYDEKLDKLIYDWKFIQRPLSLTFNGIDEGVYLIEIKSNHTNLSNILKDPEEAYRLESEISKIAGLIKVKHLIVSLHSCELVNGTSPDPLAEFFLNRKMLMKDEHRHLSLVHVEGRLYDRLLKNQEIEHFTHNNVRDAIIDNGNFANALTSASEEPPVGSHLKIFTGNGNGDSVVVADPSYYHG